MGKPFDLDRKPPPGCTTIPTFTSLSPQDRAVLSLVAEANGRTVSEEIRCAIKHWLDEGVPEPSEDEVVSPESVERLDERRAVVALRPTDLVALEALNDWTDFTAEDYARHIVQLYIGSHIDYLTAWGGLRGGEWEAPAEVRAELESVELCKRPRR